MNVLCKGLRGAFVVLIVCSSTVFCQDPIVQIKQTNPPFREKDGFPIVDGFLNDVVEMFCYVQNARGPVYWKKTFLDSYNRKDTLIISKDTQIEPDSTNYKLDKPTELQWKLRIQNIKQDDASTYSCYTEVGDRTIVEKKVNITVNDAPRIRRQELTSKTEEVEEGTTFETNCEATGIPQPYISWTRAGGAQLPGGGSVLNDNHLKIEEVDREDRGTYVCMARNKIGTDMHTDTQAIELKVRFKPSIRFSTGKGDPPVVRQAVGYRITITCIVVCNPHVNEGDVTWSKKNGDTVTNDGRRSVRLTRGANYQHYYEMRLSNVEAGDFGEYTCRATNGGEGWTNNAKIILEESDEPEADGKTGQIQGASSIYISLATIVLALIASLLHQ